MEQLHPTVIQALKWKLGIALTKAEEKQLAADFTLLMTEPEKAWTPILMAKDEGWIDLGTPAGRAKQAAIQDDFVVQRRALRRKRNKKLVPDKGARRGITAGKRAGEPGTLLDRIVGVMRADECSRGDVLWRFKERGWTVPPAKTISNLFVLGVSRRRLKRIRKGFYRAVR